MLFFFDNKKAVNLFCSVLRFSTTYSYEQESSRRSWAFLLSLVGIVEIVEISVLQRKANTLQNVFYSKSSSISYSYYSFVISISYHARRHYQNKSAWVPVSSISRVRRISFCSHTSSQFGSMWHSHVRLPLNPDNLCGLYLLGREPFSRRMSTKSAILFTSKPRLAHRLTARLNCVV